MMIQADASQLEWRAAMWLAADKTGIKEINEGIDIHSENQKVFSLPTRLIAKRYAFRTIYRGSGWAFAHDPDFMSVSDSPDFWDNVNEQFYKKYKGLDKWHSSLAACVAEHRPIISPFGREWFFLPKEDGKLPLTQLVNYPVQGTSADLMSIARVSFLRRSKARGLKALLVSTVHDSILVDSPDSEVKEVIQLFYNVFDDIPKNVLHLFGVVLPIPFPCEVKVGNNLLSMTVDVRKKPE